MTRQDTVLRSMADLRTQTQKTRIQTGNRLDALLRGADTAGDGQHIDIVRSWYQRYVALEDELDNDLAYLVKDDVLFPYVSAVKGIGPITAATLISLIDLQVADTAASIWRYAGMAVTPEGKAERLVKGQKAGYNPRLKTTCFLISTNFLRSRSPYSELYYSSKSYYEAGRSDWTKAHIHLASMRRMVKRFLAHYYEVGRTLYGLEVRRPYVEERLGHTHIDRPQDYGWPATG